MQFFLKKLFSFLALFLLLVGLLLSILFGFVAPIYTHSFNASLIDKAARLRSIDEPKLVLIGNSNVAFGFDSALLEEALGMPVVNMGLHGGLGNAFAEQAALLNPHPGDIYVVCHTEYADNNTILDPTLAWITLENHWELWQMIRMEDLPLLIKSIPSYARHIARKLLLHDESDEIPPYARQSFNRYGDVGDLREESLIKAENLLPPDINDTTVYRLNALDAMLEACGAELVIAGYPIAHRETLPDKEAFASFKATLDTALTAPVISDFSDYFMESDCFYDTVYHLTTAGAVSRTNLLIDDLFCAFPDVFPAA